ncbi:MAG: hypothetical protein WBD20_02650 [Pirellulaceae bacterium]
MPPALTTSSPVQALIRGFLLAACILALFSMLDLPLDWKIGSILLVVAGLSGTISFYDGSPRNQVRPADILMGTVHWNFTDTAWADPDEFALAVTQRQGADSEWNPDQTVLDRAVIQIHITLFHRDDESDTVLMLEPTFSGNWTQSKLLHALHQSINVDSLGEHTFFEGLVKCGEYQYHLSLGS